MYLKEKSTLFEGLSLNLSALVAVKVMCDYHQLFLLAKPVVLSVKIGWILLTCGGDTHIT